MPASRFGDNQVLWLAHHGHHAAQRLDAQRQRGHVEQQHVLDVAGEDAALNGSAHGHNFVGVHRAVGFFAKEFAHNSLHQRHTGHAAHENDFVNL